MNTYQLFMGRDIPRCSEWPDGHYITDTDFQCWLHWIDTQVDGYTVQDAQGVWQGDQEDCKIMTIACTPEQAYEVARDYRETFCQMAVGVITLPKMEFI